MIPYELAQQLKDAGYPQKPTGTPGVIYLPNLSELIEACGKRFGQLVQHDREKSEGWFATGHKIIWDSSDTRFTQVEGSTPEEAVAQLYLALNDKDQNN